MYRTDKSQFRSSETRFGRLRIGVRNRRTAPETFYAFVAPNHWRRENTRFAHTARTVVFSSVFQSQTDSCSSRYHVRVRSCFETQKEKKTVQTSRDAQGCCASTSRRRVAVVTKPFQFSRTHARLLNNERTNRRLVLRPGRCGFTIIRLHGQLAAHVCVRFRTV